MRIYHGSSQIVRTPKFGIGRTNNDFGLGFYCTAMEERAAEWAVTFEDNGFVSAYALNSDGLRIIDLCGPQYNILHWIYIISHFREFDPTSALIHQAKEYINRTFPVDFQGCDCIAGYRADDVSFALAEDFLNGRISYQFLKSVLLGAGLGTQFVLKSNRAFERITYAGYETARCIDHYPAKVSREMEMLGKCEAERGTKGLYISQFIDEEIKSYDSRL